MPKLNVNGKSVDVNTESDTPLLWVIREQVGLIPSSLMFDPSNPHDPGV